MSTLLFVLGYGRSGTSALTRVLSLSGAVLPPKLLGAMPPSPRGTWEPRRALYLNEKILRRFGSSGYDPAVFDVDVDEATVADIGAYLTTLPPAPLVVIKVPTITVLAAAWLKAADRAGHQIATVIAVRHPAEVVASLAYRIGPELASALTLKYWLLAERHTRRTPRVFVDYANLIDNYRREIKRISSALAVDLNPDEAAIEEFLTPDLRRNHHNGHIAEPFGNDWLATVYCELSAAARDELWSVGALHRVYSQYHAAEAGFSALFADHRRFHRLNRLVPLKPTVEITALMQRNNPTWK
jgi:hypothetical protein